MYDVIVLAPGGGWTTDTTGPLTRCRQRVRDLAQSNRGRRQITRITHRPTGHTVDKDT